MAILASVSDTAQPRIPPAAAAPLRTGEIAGLDGLRALSVLAVMIAHYGFGNIIPGGLGVTVFFFISGFLITTLLLREARATGDVAIGRFYMRRLLRLQPELWALLLISGVIGIVAANYWPTPLDVVSSVFYISNYAKVGVLTGGHVPDMRWPHLWSLAVEEHYYLTYPLLFAALVKAPQRLVAVFAAVLVGALALRIFYFEAGADTDYIYSVTQTRIDSIAYGCISALALWFLPSRAMDWIMRYRAICIGVAVLLLVASLGLRNPFFRDTFRYSLQGFALVLLFVGFYAGNSAFGVKLLELPALKWMGHMSYGAYLWHLEVAGGVEHVLRLPAQSAPSTFGGVEALILCALSFGAAYLSFQVFQRPVLAWRHRLGAQATA